MCWLRQASRASKCGRGNQSYRLQRNSAGCHNAAYTAQHSALQRSAARAPPVANSVCGREVATCFARFCAASSRSAGVPCRSPCAPRTQLAVSQADRGKEEEIEAQQSVCRAGLGPTVSCGAHTPLPAQDLPLTASPAATASPPRHRG